jgi:uncharacterized protein YktA (UPF0223 family)
MTDTEKKIEAMDLINELKMYFKAIVEAKREIGKQVRLATEALEKIAQFKGGKG